MHHQKKKRLWISYNHSDFFSKTFYLFSKDEEWKQARSNAAKQVVPRRVGNFVEPLCDIAEELLSHLETIQDEAGNIQDVSTEISKWTFQGVKTEIHFTKLHIRSAL